MTRWLLISAALILGAWAPASYGVAMGYAVEPGQASSVPTAPSAVQSLAAGTITSTSIQITWSAPATGTPPIAYEADIAPTGTGSWTPFATSGLTATATGLTAATGYDLRVIASNAAGTQAPPYAQLTNVSTAGSVAYVLNDATSAYVINDATGSQVSNN